MSRIGKRPRSAMVPRPANAPESRPSWACRQVFDEGNRAAEHGTRLVVVITLAMMVVEILAVWVGGAFMSDRLGRSNADLHQRLAHWKRGVHMLHTPGQWVLGLGANDTAFAVFERHWRALDSA